MQKLTTIEAARALISKLGHVGAIAAVKKMHATAEADARQAGGLFAPLFRQTQMRPVAKAELPVAEKKAPQTGTHPTPVPAARIAERQNRHVDPADPAAIRAEQMRQTREQHDDLIASIKAIHNATPNRHPSTGPVAL